MFTRALATLLSGILGLGLCLQAADATPGASQSSLHFRKVILASNLNEPIHLDISRDGRVFLVERRGGVKVWDPRDKTTKPIAALNVFSGPEDGLLGLALDPGFTSNRWIYVFHSTPGVLENRVSRFQLNNQGLDPASQAILLRIPTLAKKPNHSGGCLGFDAEGNLYASTGDYTFINDSDGYSPLDDRPGREVHDSQRTAGNSDDLRGKILRIHPERDGSYTIPKGNLFPPGTPKTRPEIYIMGCRNPFRFALDKGTGWLIWGDVGPDALENNPKRGPAGFDEFNLASHAGNYGWPYFSGNNRPYVRYDFATKTSGQAFDSAHPVNESRNNTGIRELPPAQPALIWYPPGPSTRFPLMGSGARSAMAGPIYLYDAQLNSTRKFPKELDKALFIFEWERSWIRTVRLDDQGALQSIAPFATEISVKRPIAMAFGPDGALYVIEWGTAWYNNTDAQLVRIDYVP